MLVRAIGASVILSGLAVTMIRADDWPQWLGARRDGVWRETGILDKFPKGGPKVVWRAPIGGGYTSPAIAGGHAYLMDRQGPELAKGQESPGKNGLEGSERVLCLDAKNGQLIWKHEYPVRYRFYFPSGPRTTPVVQDGKVYTLGGMGDLRCLNAADGSLVWSRSFVADYNARSALFGLALGGSAYGPIGVGRLRPPAWGWSSHLLVDNDRVYSFVGGENSAVVAFRKDNGKEVWRALTVEEIGYAPLMIYDIGGTRQLIAWHTEAINSLDPATGKLHWSVKFPVEGPPTRPGITVGAPRLDGNRLFVSCPHHGSMQLELDTKEPKAKIAWVSKSESISKTEGLHDLMSTPVVKDGHIYGICAFGELRCLKADTGERLWETYAATTGKKSLFANAFLVPQGDRFFVFNDNGDLIIARLTPKGYAEIDRAHLLEPTLFCRGRDVVWCFPTFANRCVFVRNDKELICVSLAAEG